MLWFEPQEELERLGMLHGRADRLRFLSKPDASRTDRRGAGRCAEAEHSRDGLDLSKFGRSAADQAALNLLKQWPYPSSSRLTAGALDRHDAPDVSGEFGDCGASRPGRTPLDYPEVDGYCSGCGWRQRAKGGAPQGAAGLLAGRKAGARARVPSADVRDELTRVHDDHTASWALGQQAPDVLMLRSAWRQSPVRSLRRRPLGERAVSRARRKRLARARSVQVPASPDPTTSNCLVQRRLRPSVTRFAGVQEHGVDHDELGDPMTRGSAGCA